MSIFEKHPKKTLSILLFVFVITVDILASSLLSSIGLYQPQLKIEQYYRVKNEIFHHTLTPNISQSNAKWGAIGYDVNTNSLGFKDSKPRAVSLKNKGSRILLIGDSFTEGIGFAYKDTFAGLIDERLKKKNIEVFNAGVSSYSPIIYLRKTQFLLEKGFEFDHLVVFIDISDIQDEAKHYEFDKNNNVVSRSTATENELDEKIKRFITEHTIMLSSLRILIRKLKATKDTQRSLDNSINRYRGLWTVNKEAYKDYGEKGLELAKQHMSTLAQLLKKKNIKLTVAVYPWPDQIINNDLKSKQVTFWRSWSKEHAVNFINLFPQFINDTDPKKIIEKYFLLGDVHWNKEGHELIAESVLPQL